jgi:hypothetical protein
LTISVGNKISLVFWRSESTNVELENLQGTILYKVLTRACGKWTLEGFRMVTHERSKSSSSNKKPFDLLVIESQTHTFPTKERSLW